MTKKNPTLHILCGKIAAGKSTLASKLCKSEQAILLVEDDWLHALFSDQMSTMADFVRCSGKFRSAMAPHIVSLLNFGNSVVLDFQANTVDARIWMNDIVTRSGANHALHFLDVSDEVCLERLRVRNESGTHPFSVSEEQFHKVTSHFVPPSCEEGFNIIKHAVKN